MCTIYGILLHFTLFCWNISVFYDLRCSFAKSFLSRFTCFCVESTGEKLYLWRKKYKYQVPHGRSLSRLQTWWCIWSTTWRVGIQRWQNSNITSRFQKSITRAERWRDMTMTLPYSALTTPLWTRELGLLFFRFSNPFAPSFQGNKFSKSTLMPICLPKNKG